MEAAGVEVIFDFTRNAVWGLEAFKRLFEFRKRFKDLLGVAIRNRPDVIICVDFAGFNRRFAQAVRKHLEIRGCWGSDLSHVWRAMKIMSRFPGRFPSSSLISRTYSLDNAQQALEDVQSRQVVKAVILPNGPI